MLGILPSLLVLGLVALAAVRLVSSRRSPPESVAERRDAARALAIAAGIQALHFSEEAATGLHERLPALLGLPAMPLPLFVIFNLTFLAIWGTSVPALRSARAPALFAAWFLAIAGVVNLVAHPLLAIASAGYFPGLATSPLIGGASLWLWHRLRAATRARSV